MENEKKKMDWGRVIITTILALSTAVVFLSLGYWAGTMQGEEDAATEATTSATAVVSSTATTSASTTASTVSTADWKTYTSSKYSFSVKYPADWTPTEESVKETVESKEKSDFVYFTKNGETYQIEGTDISPISISFGLAGGKTGYQIAQESKTDTDIGEEKVSQVTVGGITTSGKFINYLATRTFVVQDSNVVSLSLNNFGSGELNTLFEPIYTSMLSTFQFTK